VNNTKEKHFLFKKDIVDYLDDVSRRMDNLRTAKRRQDDNFWNPPAMRMPIVEAEPREVKWATEEKQKVPERFKKYLDFSKL
jgi:hypothetical protein